MRSFCHLLFFFLLLLSSIAFGFSTTELRTGYTDAIVNETKATLFYHSLSSAVENDPLILGYSGAAQTLLARYTYNPFSKYRYCKQGLGKLNNAISMSPLSLELRYLRLSLELSLPSFLNMSGHINEDKKVALHLLAESTDNDLNERMIFLLSKFNLYSEEQSSELINRFKK